MSLGLMLMLAIAGGFAAGAFLMGALTRGAFRAVTKSAAEADARHRAAKRKVDAVTRYAHQLMGGSEEEYDYGEHIAFLLDMEDEPWA